MKRDRITFHIVLAIIVVAALAVCPWCCHADELNLVPVETSYWTWTPVADYQSRAVHVSAENWNYAGSGVYCQYAELVGVLTADHIYYDEKWNRRARTKATVEFPDGTKLTGTYTYDKNGHDIAFIPVRHPTLSPLVVATVGPEPGDTLEMVGYGGPLGEQRHFTGTVASVGNTMRLNTAVMSGDSGSGLLNDRHEVVGIQSVGLGTLAKRGEWDIYYPSGAVGHGPICAFLQRIQNAIGRCGPNGCAPNSPGQYGDLYPPPTVPPLAPVPPAGNPDLLDKIRELEGKLKDLQLPDTKEPEAVVDWAAPGIWTLLGALGLGSPWLYYGYKLARGGYDVYQAIKSKDTVQQPPKPVEPDTLKDDVQQVTKVSVEKEVQAAASTFQGAVHREGSEAYQLSELLKLEGKNPIHYFYVGLATKDEIEQLKKIPEAYQWAEHLERKLNDRVNEVLRVTETTA